MTISLLEIVHKRNFRNKCQILQFSSFNGFVSCKITSNSYSTIRPLFRVFDPLHTGEKITFMFLNNWYYFYYFIVNTSSFGTKFPTLNNIIFTTSLSVRQIFISNLPLFYISTQFCVLIFVENSTSKPSAVIVGLSFSRRDAFKRVHVKKNKSVRIR